jgi:hypothetical protein
MSLSPLDRRPFYLVYNHLAYRFAFALVLFGSETLCSLIYYYPLIGYLCALAYIQGGLINLIACSPDHRYGTHWVLLG